MKIRRNDNEIFVSDVNKAYAEISDNPVQDIIICLADENKRLQIAQNELEQRLLTLEERVARIERYLFGKARAKQHNIEASCGNEYGAVGGVHDEE